MQVEKGRREVVRGVLAVLITIAIGIGGWAHGRLNSDGDRLTRLETQREAEGKALEQRLTTMESNLTRQIVDLREAIAKGKL